MTATSIETPELESPQLPGPDDTCDKCGPTAKAKASVTTGKGGRLTFCGHCIALYLPVLASQGARTVIS